MLVIRFLPIGKKNQPTFRIVVTEKKNAPRAGRRVENLGSYNPLTKKISVKKERILYWLSKGAKCSDSVHNLLVKEKVIEGKKIDVHKKSKKKQEPSSASADAKALADKKATEDKAKPAETPKSVEPKSADKGEEKPKEPSFAKASASAKATVDKPSSTKATEGKPSFAKASEGKEKK